MIAGGLAEDELKLVCKLVNEFSKLLPKIQLLAFIHESGAG
jgi:hypothetical protein